MQRRRPRMHHSSIQIPGDDLVILQAIADRERCSVARVIRIAIENELERRGYPIGRPAVPLVAPLVTPEPDGRAS